LFQQRLFAKHTPAVFACQTDGGKSTLVSVADGFAASLTAHFYSGIQWYASLRRPRVRDTLGFTFSLQSNERARAAAS